MSTKPSSSVAADTEFRVTRGMNRFEVRADVEALFNYFINHDVGAEPDSRTSRPRHVSVSSMMEHGFNQQGDTSEGDKRWQTELKERLENIEKTLFVLSKQGEKRFELH
jgi:hypothetical protein